MNEPLSHRDFVRGLVLGATTAALPSSLLATKKRDIHIGQTVITWRITT